MLILGLTGGIASGKSFVANLLAKRGAKVIDADQLAHKVLAEKEILDQLASRWGQKIIKPDGSPNRSEIAKIVFANTAEADAEKNFLEGLVHPQVRKRIDEQLKLAESDGFEVAVLDIPLLHESGWDERCNLILHVDTPQEVRQSRAAERGWNPAEHAKREANQLSIDQKNALADHVVSGFNHESSSADIAKIWDNIINP